ncbi:MAG: TIGR02710 family CRISPR-associated protein, partial [Bryobacteraceae bacterium]|nr:TIGR02710 family CRISPR-associated protein [Bryobacteraceae bacterium]
MNERTALLVTVGMGDKTQLENSLFSPFLKTLLAGKWDKVVLLCSRETEPNARLLAERHPDVTMQIETLPRNGDEANLDRCFSFFEQVVSRLVEQDGYRPYHLTADFTRGTKVMSAALALAAASHGIKQYRYIDGEQRNQQGLVIGGTEKLLELSPEHLFRAQRLSLAYNFLKEGEFSSVLRVIQEKDGPKAPWLLWAAEFWGAWDRFHYSAAKKSYQRLAGTKKQKRPPRMEEFWPSEAQLSLLDQLSRAEPAERKPELQADATRCLAADLYQNTLRRLREGQYEEVLLRLYRLVELVGQIRLFEHGIDSGHVRKDDPRVQAFIQSLEHPPKLLPGGHYELARENVAKLLEHLKDPFASRLMDLNWLGLNVKTRNRSILIHGFKARTAQTREADLHESLGA